MPICRPFIGSCLDAQPYFLLAIDANPSSQTFNKVFVDFYPLGGILNPFGVAVTPDGSKVYFAGTGLDAVWGLSPATLAVAAIFDPAGDTEPESVSVTPDGTSVYVASNAGDNVFVGSTATNSVVATIPVGKAPLAFGIFIQSKPKLFAGTPLSPTCHSKSVSALSQQYGNNLGAAATALGFTTVSALQNAITGYCSS